MCQVTQQTLLSHPYFISFLCGTERTLRDVRMTYLVLPTHSAMTYLVPNPLKLPEPWDLFSDTISKMWFITIPQYHHQCTNYNKGVGHEHQE